MSEFHCNAVENTILNLLVASETNFEYPRLQNEALDLISNNIADIVYNSLKQKSTASATKRCNLLKFLNNICKTPELHSAENHYKVYLKQYEQEFCKTNNNNFENISKELEDVANLHENVKDFYKLKNRKRKDKLKKLDFIERLDREKLNNSMHVTKNLSHYETSENLIDDLLKENETKFTEPLKIHSKNYREKQVQFCYAIINIAQDNSDIKILENVLNRIHNNYNLLERFEIKMLTDLWLIGECQNLNLTTIISEKFPFIIEKIVIKHCTELIKLKDICEVSKYFSDLDENSHIKKIRELCTNNLAFYYKLKNMIFELYVYSYCNENVYRFCNYII